MSGCFLLMACIVFLLFCVRHFFLISHFLLGYKSGVVLHRKIMRMSGNISGHKTYEWEKNKINLFDKSLRIMNIFMLPSRTSTTIRIIHCVNAQKSHEQVVAFLGHTICLWQFIHCCYCCFHSCRFIYMVAPFLCHDLLCRIRFIFHYAKYGQCLFLLLSRTCNHYYYFVRCRFICCCCAAVGASVARCRRRFA